MVTSPERWLELAADSERRAAEARDQSGVAPDDPPSTR
jgi:hypothetical protein